MSKFTVAFCTAAFLVTCMYAIFTGGAGIVAVEGYEHGVALCGNQMHDVVGVDEATVWADEYATYVINAGHEGDPEVVALQAAALIECSKY